MAMTEAYQTQSAAFEPGGVIARMLREAEHWTAVQCELLTGIEKMWAQWMERQRDAVGASIEALRQMGDCRNVADLLQLQQQWLADNMHRGAADISALASEAVSIGQSAVLSQKSRNRSARRPMTPAGERLAEQRQAAE
jgi:hypothetical protein